MERLVEVFVLALAGFFAAAVFFGAVFDFADALRPGAGATTSNGGLEGPSPLSDAFLPDEDLAMPHIRRFRPKGKAQCLKRIRTNEQLWLKQVYCAGRQDVTI